MELHRTGVDGGRWSPGSCGTAKPERLSQKGRQEPPETERWPAPAPSATGGHRRPLLGGREDWQLLGLCLCSSFAPPLPSPHPFISSPPQRSLSLIHSLSLLFSLVLSPTSVPSCFDPSLETDFLLSHPFFFLRAQNHTWQLSPPTTLPSRRLSSPPPCPFLPPPLPLRFSFLSPLLSSLFWSLLVPYRDTSSPQTDKARSRSSVKVPTALV